MANANSSSTRKTTKKAVPIPAKLVKHAVRGETGRRALSLVARPSPHVATAIRREDYSGSTFFSGPLQAIIAAGIARPDWFEDGTKQRMRQGKPITIRKRTFEQEGRRIITETSKGRDFVHLWIYRTEAEQEAYDRREAERKREREAEQARRHEDDERARVAAMSPAEWKANIVTIADSMLTAAIKQLAGGQVKRITTTAHQRLVELSDQLYEAMRKAEVITVDTPQPSRPALRLVKAAMADECPYG